ncbi:transcription factor cmr1 [Niveomyces insectorum RCEF 264]|uniref:Transcription factor cmr1 n=1 Tax=Niveomyces insectorum RCEF 264 TaxID=1081102 RepID=A0A167US56_9HYPO|nr:transcription factor cmr1 [Niveomyces insectorum RCEF 264]
MVVFCAYCGKSFTRKEHLERHIPSHTNVKPHRCSACQLSFARRDLLQRHHATYHEARDPMEPLPGGVPTIAGRTPIACQNCANAKTGCDKRVPCSRCAEKNLPCSARFARRSSKAAMRAAQANAAAASAAAAAAAAAFTGQLVVSPTHPGQQPLTPTFLDLEHHLAAAQQQQQQQQQQSGSPLRSPLGLGHVIVGDNAAAAGTLDMCLPDLQQRLHSFSQQQPQPQQQQHHHHHHHHIAGKKSPSQHHAHSQLNPHDEFVSTVSPQGHGVEALDEFMGFGAGNHNGGQGGGAFLAPETACYQDLIWADYSMDLDLYASPLHADMSSVAAAAGFVPTPPFTATTELSDVSSNSEPMTVSSSSSHGSSSVHTNATSIFSPVGFHDGGNDDGSSGSNCSSRSNSVNDIGNVFYSQQQQQIHLQNQSQHQQLQQLQRQQQQHHHQQQQQQQRQHHYHQAIPAPLLTMTAHAPCADESAIPEFEVVLASEAAWPLARCTPPIFSGSCPRTAIVHLECLEQKSKQEGTWNALEQYLESHQPAATDAPQVVPLHPRSRDKMLAITQSFLHKALDVHRAGLSPTSGNSYGGASGGSGVGGGGGSAASPGADFKFLVLPPSRILEYFLRTYVQSLSIYYPLVVGGIVDPNEMLDNSQASTLLVLLMIAQGAAMVPMAEARYLSAGLTETCRISLFDIIEKNVELSADPTALRCALLFTLLGAWGGDKWHMDIAMGQRSMYLAMLKHAGMLEPPQPLALPQFGSPTSAELQWRSWLHREAQSRLVYNWVMVDQELSLFHDTAPVLSISDLQCPLPSPDALWLASTSERWLAAVQSSGGSNGSPNNNGKTINERITTLSLCELFQAFLDSDDDQLAPHEASLSPQQLRLLLHPLQNMLCHLRQMLSCLPEATHASASASATASTTPSASTATVSNSTTTTTTAAAATAAHRRAANRAVTRASTLQRLEEVQAQLQRWYELSMAYYRAHPGCAATRCNLVLYHLISLNAVTNFPEVERHARREDASPSSSSSLASSHTGSPSFWEAPANVEAKAAKERRQRQLLQRCIFQREEAVFHCGQVLRLLRQMPADHRPSWWSAALYRAVLILWTDSIGRRADAASANAVSETAGSRRGSASTVMTTPASSMSSTAPTPTSSQSSNVGTTTTVITTANNNINTTNITISVSPVAIDQVTPEDPGILSYLWSGEGVVVLTHGDGSRFTLDSPADILCYGVQRLDEAMSSRISDGIRRKLLALATNWGL